jgi:hypothetical protein
MRIPLLLAAACLGLVTSPSFAADPPAAPPPALPDGPAVVLKSAHFAPGLPLAEGKTPVYAVSIDARVNEEGDGTGKLFLNPNPPLYDEYGDLVTGWEAEQVRPRRNALPVLALECRIEFVKKGSVPHVNEAPVERSAFLISGPKIKSTLLFATTGPGLTSGRLLVHDKDNRVEYVVEMHELKPVDPNLPTIPCHPGCFPGGTPVLVPGGDADADGITSRAIETIRVGDLVTTVSADGDVANAPVEHLFTTTNRLVELRTDRGMAITTEAQPFCLTDGTFRKAGDLKEGDRVWHWHDGRREEAAVRGVKPTGREARVYNLILGGSAMFVACDFVVRGKPPADAPGAAAAVAP